MSSTQTLPEAPAQLAPAATVDLKLEVVIIPVSDVDRAKQFYGSLGWRLDADFAFENGLRVVQFTPPGSGCSIQFGTKISSAPPGSVRDLYLVVSDIDAARKELAARGADISEVFHPLIPGAQFEPLGAAGRETEATSHNSYRSFATFTDPDGNSWLLQEVTARLPGRGQSSLDVASLTELLRETEEQHGQHEAAAPKHHWSQWYAGYMVARVRGKAAVEAATEATQGIKNAAPVAKT